jgi:hypothetical protein
MAGAGDPSKSTHADARASASMAATPSKSRVEAARSAAAIPFSGFRSPYPTRRGESPGFSHLATATVARIREVWSRIRSENGHEPMLDRVFSIKCPPPSVEEDSRGRSRLLFSRR